MYYHAATAADEELSIGALNDSLLLRENIRHISEVLKSQIALYSELCDLMLSEKSAIVSWEINKTVEIAKRKEELLRREEVQEKARNLLLSRFAELTGRDACGIIDVVKACSDGDLREEVNNLVKRLKELVSTIHAENIALRMLYSINTRMINDFFTQAGLVSQSYGGDAAMGAAQGGQRISTIHRIV